MYIALRTIATSAALALILTACSDDKPATEQAAAPPAETVPEAPAEPVAETVPEPAPAAEETVAEAPAEEAEPPPEALAEPAEEAAAEAASPSYQVDCPDGAARAEDCTVDQFTYVGWRTYQSQCFQCHGGSGLGTTIAPNLMERFNKNVDHERFVKVMKEGFTGQMGAMPSFDGNPNVIPHLDNLYAYLRARADDALPAGRPGR